LASGFFTLAVDTIGSATVFPGVHLLGDDVGFFPYSSGEEFGGLEDGRTDFSESVTCEDGAGGGLDVVTESGFGREKVAGAADCFESGHHLQV